MTDQEVPDRNVPLSRPLHEAGFRAAVVANGKTMRFECQHCAASERIAVPASIDDVIAQGAAFAKRHGAECLVLPSLTKKEVETLRAAWEGLASGPADPALVLCEHRDRKPCAQCRESFCPDCDPYHRDNCADSNRP